MNKKVLLLQLPVDPTDEAVREGYSIYLQEPMGLGYLAAIASQEGYEAKVLMPQSIAELQRVLAESSVAIIGVGLPFSATIKPVLRGEALSLIRQLVGPSIPLIAGGHAATATAKWLMEQAPELDAVCIGEGEETFREVLVCLQLGQDWRDIPGLMVRRGDVIQFTGPGLLVANLDDLPFPDRSWLPPDAKQVFMVGSRGCRYNCTFCDIPQFADHSQDGRQLRWRGRSPADIVAEMRYIRQQWPDAHIIMIDDEALVGRKTEAVLELAHVMRNAQFGSIIEMTTSASSIIRCHEAWPIFREAGLRIVYYGADSGSVAQLRRYKKPSTVAKNLEAARILVESKIAPSVGFIMFDPAITFSELEENLNFLEAMHDLGVPIHASALTNRLISYAGAPLAGDKADADELTLPLPPVMEALLADWLTMSVEVIASYAQYPPRKVRKFFSGKNEIMRLEMAKILALPQVINRAREILAVYRERYDDDGDRSSRVELPVILH